MGVLLACFRSRTWRAVAHCGAPVACLPHTGQARVQREQRLTAPSTTELMQLLVMTNAAFLKGPRWVLQAHSGGGAAG